MLRSWRILASLIWLSRAIPGFGFVGISTTKHPCHAITTKLGAVREVLQTIAGVDWEGSCRYVDQQLAQAPFELQGGIRFDLDQDDDVRLQSFVVFPNGKRRDIEMSSKEGSQDDSLVRLDSTNSPIAMVLAQVGPDTILINEIDKVTGRIAVTSSLSLVSDAAESSIVAQLIMVSHEVAAQEDPVTTTTTIAGHQIWRYNRKGAND